MASWASFHAKTLDRKKMMDELEYQTHQYDLGNVKSWDLDATRARLCPAIQKLNGILDEEYFYLWTRTGVLETMTEWRERTEGWSPQDFAADAEDYYTSVPKRRERHRQEQARLNRLAEQKAARDLARSA